MQLRRQTDNGFLIIEWAVVNDNRQVGAWMVLKNVNQWLHVCYISRGIGSVLVSYISCMVPRHFQCLSLQKTDTVWWAVSVTEIWRNLLILLMPSRIPSLPHTHTCCCMSHLSLLNEKRRPHYVHTTSCRLTQSTTYPTFMSYSCIFYTSQYQKFGENLTATVLRSLEIANFVDSVSSECVTLDYIISTIA